MKSLEIRFLTDWGGGGGGGMVCSYFSEERRLFSNFVQQKLFQNFTNCNYDQNSS